MHMLKFKILKHHHKIHLNNQQFQINPFEMAWLFACFGCPNKRKRHKSSYRVHSQDKGIGKYRPLESPSSCLPEDSKEQNTKPVRSNLKRRKQGKDRERKKVRFDLNVIAYEPVQGYNNGDDDDDDLRSILVAAKWGEENEEDNTEVLDGGKSCTFTYRYSNCEDDDNDELESEIEDDLSDEEDEEVTCKTDLSRCVNPVLFPIENLNQWRAIKMKKWETVV